MRGQSFFTVLIHTVSLAQRIRVMHFFSDYPSQIHNPDYIRCIHRTFPASYVRVYSCMNPYSHVVQKYPAFRLPNYSDLNISFTSVCL